MRGGGPGGTSISSAMMSLPAHGSGGRAEGMSPPKRGGRGRGWAGGGGGGAAAAARAAQRAHDDVPPRRLEQEGLEEELQQRGQRGQAEQDGPALQSAESGRQPEQLGGEHPQAEGELVGGSERAS